MPVLIALAPAACGVRSPPLPPLTDTARPPTGDPNMVPTGTVGTTTPVPADNNTLRHMPAYPDGGPPWLLKQAADAGEVQPTTP